ncbi:hypothetical protein VRB95_06275 [Erwinia aphidicola]|uniref:hypothetical protein n=1 Tax=Erwinia aphidicola TaxID=68334 RepID=UPI0030CFAAA0
MMETEVTRRFNHVANIAEELHEVTAALEVIVASDFDDFTSKAALKCVLRAQFAAMNKLDSIFNSI